MQGHGQRRGGWRRCVAPQCGRFVQPGEVVCEDHREGVVGRDATAAFRRMAASVAEMGGQTDRRTDGQKERGAEAFRRRLERGEYRELVEGPVRAVMVQAAEEVGALRFALARLLSEEEDPVRLSLGVSRLATASARLARTRRELDEGMEPLNEAISQILRDLDGEREGRGS